MTAAEHKRGWKLHALVREGIGAEVSLRMLRPGREKFATPLIFAETFIQQRSGLRDE